MDPRSPMKFFDRRGLAIDAAAIAALRARSEFALAQVLAALDLAGVAVLPVKGIITGRWLFTDPYERPLSDVDLRAMPEDLDAIIAICQQKHWPITQRSTLYRNVTFTVEDTSFDVETTVGARGMSSLSVEAMLRRALRTRELIGVEHWRADVHDHALLLVMNVVKDQLGRCFRWAIEDLIRVARVPEFSPRALAQRAWQAGNASVLAAVSGWLAAEQHSDPWRAVLAALGAVPRQRYARTVQRALEDAQHPRSSLVRTALARSANDLLLQRIISLSTVAAWAQTRLAAQLSGRAIEQIERWRPSAQQSPSTRSR